MTAAESTSRSGVELRGISHSFGQHQVLKDVSFRIEPGRIQGLLGENGAGKSTLMNLLFGLLSLTHGDILIDGRPVTIDSPARARALGIGMVHQHFKLVAGLSVLENLAFALDGNYGPIRRKFWAARLGQLADSLGWSIDPHCRVGDLSVGQQQRLEILKALAGPDEQISRRLLILDEPTAVLTPQESSQLLEGLEKLRRRPMSILLISHKLSEVRQACEHVTILRHGSCVYDGATLSGPELTRHMLGEAITLPQRTAAPHNGRKLLELRNCSLEFSRGQCLRNVSFTLHGGEILGVAGVDGNGQSALLEGLLAVASPPSITWHVPRRHLGLIPEDRQREALVLPMTLRENLGLQGQSAAGPPPFTHRGGWIDFPAWRRRAAALVERFDVRGAGLEDPAARLSGGNQQKLVLARELSDDPQVILAINPTRGLDLGAAAFVLRELLAARARGAGILLLHSDLEELLHISDRVGVLFNGRWQESPTLDRDTIGRMMMGYSEGAFHRTADGLVGRL